MVKGLSSADVTLFLIVPLDVRIVRIVTWMCVLTPSTTPLIMIKIW